METIVNKQNSPNPWQISENGITEEQTEAFKKLSNENPKKADEVLTLWAKQVWDTIKKISNNEQKDPTVTKERIKNILSPLEQECFDTIKNLFQEAAKGKVKKFDKSFPKVSGDVKINISTLLNNIHIDVWFNNPRGFANYIFAENEGVSEDTGNTQPMLTNTHREISHNLRGCGIGQWLENISEKAAAEVGLTELKFRSRGDNYQSIIYPLTQGYSCENQKDRETMAMILNYLHQNPKNYHEPRTKQFPGVIEFKKKLSIAA